MLLLLLRQMFAFGLGAGVVVLLSMALVANPERFLEGLPTVLRIGLMLTTVALLIVEIPLVRRHLAKRARLLKRERRGQPIRLERAVERKLAAGCLGLAIVFAFGVRWIWTGGSGTGCMEFLLGVDRLM